MTNKQHRKTQSRRFQLSFAIIILFILNVVSLSMMESKNSENSLLNNDDFQDILLIDDLKRGPESSELFSDNILYSGELNGLNINESAKILRDETVLLGNGDESGFDDTNLSFYIDETHDWQVEKYNATITELSDEQNWVENSIFGNNENLTANITVVQTIDDGYSSYNNGLVADPNNPLATIDGQDSDYMRLHFVLSYTEDGFDYTCLWDDNDELFRNYTGHFDDFWTPWFETSIIKLGISSDSSNKDDGFEIDTYEMYNGTMHDNWTHYREYLEEPYRLDGSMDNYSGRASVYSQLKGVDNGDDSYSYDIDDESGFIQNLTIPRGEVIEAWISMDYFLHTGIGTNDMLIYYKINNKIVYTRGFITIRNMGKDTWHTTGLINMLFWDNTTDIFDSDISDDNINVSFGIRSAKGSRYSGFEDREIQKAYFDNVKLILKTKTNSTLSDIDLQFNGNSLTDDSSNWGSSTYEESGLWTNDPLNISMNTSAPKLEFNINSEVLGYHYTLSKESGNGQEGLQLSILGDDSIVWDFYHNVFRPTGYENYEFIIEKPYDWNITSVKDPTGIETLYEGGLWSDNFVEVNENYAFFPGWWHFSAESTNLVMKSQTEIWNGTDWELYDEISDGSLYYNVGDHISIQTKLDESNGLINSVELTEANLTVYHPNETIWFSESMNPDVGANIQFTNLTAGAYNTTGGIYTYKIIWTNGTSAGGLNGTFEIRHNVEYKILYPRDAELDQSTDKYLGEIIPMRLILNNSANGILLHDAVVVYNWTSGSIELNEISNGIYDGSIDTLDLGDVGVYYVQFNISKSGYYNLSFTLTINLVAATNLKILNIANNIELGSNFTIEVEYIIDPSSLGIENALIELNMSTSDYFVSSGSSAGEYLINVSTASLIATGSLDIKINATKTLYDTQELVTRVQILPTSVYFNVYVNESDCTSNKSWNDFTGNIMNFTVEVFNSLDDQLITGGSVMITESGPFEQNFVDLGNAYNALIGSSSVGIGIHYMNIIFNKTEFETTSMLFIIGIDTRESYYQIFINQSDCTSNKSWNDEAGNFLNVTIDVFDQLTGKVLSGGIVNLTNNQGFTKTLEFNGNNYTTIMNTFELGFGTHYLTILVNKTDYEIQTGIFILTISPIEAYLKLKINLVDHTANKSGTINIGQNVIISVEAFSTIGDDFIDSAILRIDDYSDFQESFVEGTLNYQISFNSSELGIGVHFLNIIFEKSNYLTTSIVLQLKIDRIELSPSFHETESTILSNPDEEFEATILLIDQNTGNPILGAEVAYNWLYGTGVLEEIGNGYYKLSETIPSQEGTFTIEISINAGDQYFSSSLDLTIISQKAELNVQDLWWLLIPIALILVALGGIVVKQNVINPKRAKEFELLKMKTQIFDDVTNIRGVMVIQKISGLLLYRKIISGMDDENETLFTGFLNAIMMLSQRFTNIDGENTDNGVDGSIKNNNSESIEFKHENFNILVMDGENVRIALILESSATPGIKQMVNKFISEFEGIFSSFIVNWDGNTTMFEETGSQLIEEVFNLSLLGDYTLTESSNRGIIEKKLVNANSLTSDSIGVRTLAIIDTLIEERPQFKLKTVISLTPEEDKMPAKDMLLIFIKNNLLVHPEENNKDPIDLLKDELEKVKRNNS